MKKANDNKVFIHVLILVTILATAKCAEAEITMEAAFQGHCGHTSPCEQLCYEIHDGMYECDCIEGYELNQNGYSCQVNSTTNFDGHSKSDEDVLYQKGASFSAKLANGSDRDNQILFDYSPSSSVVRGAHDAVSASDSSAASMSSASTSMEDGRNGNDNGEESDNFFNDDQKSNEELTMVNSNDYYISSDNVYFTNGDDRELTNTSQDVPEPTNTNSMVQTMRARQIIVTAATDGPSGLKSTSTTLPITGTSESRENLSRNDQLDVVAVQSIQQQSSDLHLKQSTYQDDLTNLTISKYNKYDTHKNLTPSLKENATNTAIWNKLNISKEGKTVSKNDYICNLDCGAEGMCERIDDTKRCLCPFGKSGKGCLGDNKIRIPKFSKRSWIAFSALRGAYKHVQIRIEFRPESFDGIILLSGERDDLTGDFMALLLNKGFIEFWFDCGSGSGSVRSRETILLNEWNSVIVYRHRWDAWLVLNHGTKVQGRSNGLFSRITFREPVFLGGTGNITGLAKRLPVYNGFVGCIRRFVANEHDYKFVEHPLGDITKGFDIQDCVTDKCFKYPCQHGGKCLPSDQGAVCLCPIGFVGDLCEIRMDLQVPAFNGSSYLHYAPLGDSALIWLELKIILKAELPDGLILYSGSEKHADFIALYLSGGFIEFIFDLGSGPAVVRSEYPLMIGQWHSVKISRTARLAVLKIDNFPEVMTISSNGFWHLSLPGNVFLGGVSHVDKLPLALKSKAFFVGCIQKIDINGHSVSIISEALGGTNIGNCPHACVAKPCGPLVECVPQMESYECRCSNFSIPCNIPDRGSVENMNVKYNKSKNNDKFKNKKGKHHSLYKSTKPGAYSKYHLRKVDSKKCVQQRKMASSLDNTEQNKSWIPRSSEEEFLDKQDDIIYRDVRRLNGKQLKVEHSLHRKQSNDMHLNKQQQNKNVDASHTVELSSGDRGNGKVHDKAELHHKRTSALNHKLSRLPKHYESFQTNPERDILTFDENVELEFGGVSSQAASKENLPNKDNDNEYYTNIGDSNTAEYFKESMLDRNSDWKYDEYGVDLRNAHDAMNEETKSEPFFNDETLFDPNSPEDYHRKELQQDMRRILANGPENTSIKKGLKLVVDEYDYESMDSGSQNVTMDDTNTTRRNSSTTKKFRSNYAENNDDLLEPVQTVAKEVAKKVNLKKALPTSETQTDWILLKRLQLPPDHHSQFGGVRKNFGACFAGKDSYFHYNDGDTMSQVINYNIDLNLRIKTHSQDGIILWTGRKGATQADADFLSLGIENGYLHFRYDLGSGEVDIRYNMSRVSDGLWHRVRAIRDSQAGYLEVDGRKTATQYSPGKLKQLNTDTGLYVGGIPNGIYFTRRKYKSGFIGCITEIVLAGELKLSFDANTLGIAHNVETGLL